MISELSKKIIIELCKCIWCSLLMNDLIHYSLIHSLGFFPFFSMWIKLNIGLPHERKWMTMTVPRRVSSEVWKHLIVKVAPAGKMAARNLVEVCLGFETPQLTPDAPQPVYHTVTPSVLVCQPTQSPSRGNGKQMLMHVIIVLPKESKDVSSLTEAEKSMTRFGSCVTPLR